MFFTHIQNSHVTRLFLVITCISTPYTQTSHWQRLFLTEEKIINFLKIYRRANQPTDPPTGQKQLLCPIRFLRELQIVIYFSMIERSTGHIILKLLKTFIMYKVFMHVYVNNDVLDDALFIK